VPRSRTAATAICATPRNSTATDRPPLPGRRGVRAGRERDRRRRGRRPARPGSAAPRGASAAAGRRCRPTGRRRRRAPRGGAGRRHPPGSVTRRNTSRAWRLRRRPGSPPAFREDERPFERIRTRSQISSTRWRRCDETMTAAPPSPSDDRLLHPPDAARVDAGQRLVEDQDLRSWRRPKAMTSFCFIPRDSSDGAPAPCRRAPVPRGGPPSAPPRRDAVEARGKREVVGHREVVEEARLVGHEGEAAFRLHGVPGEVEPRDRDRPRSAADAGEAAEVVVFPAPFGPTRRGPGPAPRRRRGRPRRSGRDTPSRGPRRGSRAEFRLRGMPRLDLVTAGESHGPKLSGIVTGLPPGSGSTRPASTPTSPAGSTGTGGVGG